MIDESSKSNKETDSFNSEKESDPPNGKKKVDRFNSEEELDPPKWKKEVDPKLKDEQQKYLKL